MDNLISGVIASANTGEGGWGVLSCNVARILGVPVGVSKSNSVLWSLSLFPKMLQ